MSLSQARKLIIGVVVALVLTSAGYWYFRFDVSGEFDLVNPVGREASKKQELPLRKYSFESMANYLPKESEVNLEEVIEENDEFTSYIFSFETEGRRMTGQVNVPVGEGKHPVVLMLRGYVPENIYVTGVGTGSAAAYFARHGFLTVAPDFFGYGGSDDPSEDAWEERVSKVRHVLDLLVSLRNIEGADTGNVFLWGHSNGGQIALSVLEITGKSPYFEGRVFPTTLWAPVSKPFPYSVLFYTDEGGDYGKALRKSLAEFEEKYDVDEFSIHAYYDWIESPIQLHQGTSDDAVPLDWSNELVATLDEIEKEVRYFTYNGADHNLRPAWDTVVARDLGFFRSYLEF